MDWLYDIIQSESARHLMQALLHSLWQGTAIAGCLLILLRTISIKSAGLRYGAAVGALALTVFLVFITWSVLDYNRQPERQVVVPGIESQGQATIVEMPQQPVVKPEPVAVAKNGVNYYTAIFCLWLTGAVVMSLRAMVLVFRAGRVVSLCRAVDDPALLGLIERLAGRMRIKRKIRVYLSDKISVPAIIGVLRPIVFLPAVAVGMPLDQLNAILAHELAHIRRYDYLVNLLQMLFEAVLFFNPAIWWISRQIRLEREACCDCCAVAVLGMPVSYARVLVDWAERIGGMPSSAVAMPGFAGDGNQSGLLERVKRLIVSGHKPAVKMSWMALTGMILLSAGVLLGLRFGSAQAVNYVGNILTHQQRVEKMQEIAEDYTTSPEEVLRAAIISGTVRTIDNKPLPDDLQITGMSYAGNNSFFIGGPVKDGKFSFKARGTAVMLQVDLDGYATKYYGPFNPKPDEVRDNIDIVLDYGFTGRIKVVGPDGELVRNARLGGWIHGSRNFTYYNTYFEKLTSNADGVIEYPLCPDVDMHLNIVADGYQIEKKNVVRLKDDEDYIWQLKKAVPAEGVVIDKNTRKPLAGVQVGIWDLIHPDKYVTTDEQGRFALTSLSDGCEYTIRTKLDGYQQGAANNVRPGTTGINIEMFPELHITGKILGDINEIQNAIWNSGSKGKLYYDNGNIKISDKEGIGYFDIHGFWGDIVKISLNGKNINDYEKDFDLSDNKSITDLVIDLRDKPVDMSKPRRVFELHFKKADGSLVANSKVQFKYNQKNENTERILEPIVPIIDGKASVEVEVPCDVTFRPVAGDGYWFINNKMWSDIKEGVGPFVQEVTVYPAGSIYGDIFDVDGTPCFNAFSHVYMIQPPDELEDHQNALEYYSYITSPSSRFMAAPLPLGGEYVIAVNQGNTYVISEITLTEAEPIKNVRIDIIKGQTVRGQMLDQNGKPIPNLEYSFCGKYSWGNNGFSNSSPDSKTNLKGEFVLDGINFQNKMVKYSIEVASKKDYRPARMSISKSDKPLTLQLESGLICHGVVIDSETGWPVSGVELYVTPADGEAPESFGFLNAEETTDSDGKFRFSNLGDKKYEIGVRSCNLFDSQNPIIIKPGQKNIIVKVRLNVNGSELKARAPEKK